MKMQNELKGNTIDWGLTSLEKESKFMDSDQDLKLAILTEIAEGNATQQSIAKVVHSVYDRITTEKKILDELDKIYASSTLVADVKKKHYELMKQSVLSGKLTDSFLTKGFKCLEWQNILQMFQSKVKKFLSQLVSRSISNTIHSLSKFFFKLILGRSSQNTRKGNSRSVF
jgi:hypothetical protein